MIRIALSQIITICISILSATGILGLWTSRVLRRLHAQDTRQKAMELGVQALLRDRMLQAYRQCAVAGCAPVDVKENFENLYTQYHNLGGNGVMTRIHQELLALPTEEEHHHDN